MFVEYHRPLTELARELRVRETPSEKIFWTVLRKRKFLGYKFMRQRPIASYIADFYCDALRLVIELDGEIHASQKEYDHHRTKELNGLGIIVIRYSNEQIQKELPRVLSHLKKVIRAIESSPLAGERGWG